VDSFGHVNNSVYLRYFEKARNDFMLQRGLKFSDFSSWGAGPILFSLQIDFKAPARTDDELVISGVLKPEGRIRFYIEHQVHRKPDQQLICTARLGFAFVSLPGGKPVRVPEAFSKAFCF
jgi:acyl-CoA thioester hydrolase